MKFKRIRTKMMATILPPIIAAMGVLAVVSLLACSNIVNEQISETMDASLNAESETINEYLELVRSMAMTVSRTVGTTYKSMELSQYEDTLAEIIQDNDMVLGSGIWFEPYVYDKEEKYVGPYIYKDGSEIDVTYDYSNAEYDYFGQEYYTNAKSSKEPVITDPYYDATSNTIMSSCSMAIYDGSKFIGCVTVDIELSSIEDVIAGIHIGENGTAFLLSEGGVYLAGVDSQKIQNNQSVLDDENASLAKAGATVVSVGSGETVYTGTDGTEYNLYFDTIPSTGWHIAIQMPKSELLKPMLSLLYKLVFIAVAALAICCVIVLWQVSSIAGGIRQVQSFAQNLAKGDFTINALQVHTEDELGIMGASLNEMYQGNRDVISNISIHSDEIAGSSSHLKEAAGKLTEAFEKIQDNIGSINEAMVSASASTEEVNASVEVLASEVGKSQEVSLQIRKRAGEVEKASRSAYQTATDLTVQYEQRLGSSIENAKVVDSIGAMVDGIAGIAEQIKLLSVNASIEAARAGEWGEGFAVVAGEVRSLAGETEKMVDNIQDIIGAVQKAFAQLLKDSGDLLAFVQDTVTPDYDKFVATAGQYGKDADFFAENAEQISAIMSEVRLAMQTIADAAQNTASTGGMVMASVQDVSRMVDDVSDMSHKQQEIADNLDSVVKRFKL